MSSSYNESPYKVLGLSIPSSGDVEYTDADIGRAYRRTSLQAHPDKPGGSKIKFARVKVAYETLQTSRQRALYREYGSSMEKSAGHVLGETVDKIMPLVLGLLGGLSCVWAGAVNKNINLPILILISTLGGGTLVSYKAPLLEVLLASVGGIVVGGSLGSVLYGLVWLLSWVF